MYTGITLDVQRRFKEHQGGGARAAKYLRGKGPLTLVACWCVGDRSTALRLERKIKRLPAQEKQKLTEINESTEDLLIRLKCSKTT